MSSLLKQDWIEKVSLRKKFLNDNHVGFNFLVILSIGYN